MCGFIFAESCFTLTSRARAVAETDFEPQRPISSPPTPLLPVSLIIHPVPLGRIQSRSAETCHGEAGGRNCEKGCVGMCVAMNNS